MLRLLRQLRVLLSPREKWQCLGLSAFMAVGAGLELLGLGLVMPVIAAFTKPELLEQNALLRDVRAWIAPASERSFILFVSAGVIALYVLKNAYLVWLARFQARFALRKAETLSTRLFNRYLLAPYAFHLRRSTTACLNNVTRITPVMTYSLLPLLGMATELAVMAAMYLTLVFFAPLMGLTLAAVMALVLAAGYFPMKNRNHRIGQAVRRHADAVATLLLQALGGVKEIRIAGREDAFAEQMAAWQRGEKQALLESHIFAQLPRFFIEAFLVALTMGALMLSVISGVADGTVLLRFALLAMITFRSMPSLSRVQYTLASIRQQQDALDQIYRDLHEVPPPPPEPAAPPLTFTRAVEVRDLEFRYEGADAPLLSGVSLRLPCCTATALVGPTGGGKTTLVDLIVGLLEPSAGGVFADGRDIREHPPSWRRRIGYVPQPLFLLDDTVRANVAFGVPEGEIDEARVEEALRLAQAREFVRELPQGTATPVGEGGNRLSGGQRQRLGIARALYGRPSLLVLDEATSALDPDTERAFADALASLRGKLTILMATHRPATVESWDQIIRVEAPGASILRALPGLLDQHQVIPMHEGVVAGEA